VVGSHDLEARALGFAAGLAWPEMNQAGNEQSGVPDASLRSNSARQRLTPEQAANEVKWRMSNVFSPRLDILPAAQQRLWPELVQTPDHFILYGGTAIALRLGHRQSVDFDFFTLMAFQPHSLLEELRYLKGAVVRRSSANNLTVTVDRGGPVQLSFFGALGFGQVATEELAEGPRLKVATLIDLAGMKAAVVTQRAEVRDYLDIHALLTKANISLAKMLAAGIIIYGAEFNPLLSLKAISYHDDLALADLPQSVRRDLAEAVRTTDPQKLPVLNALRTRETT
jgi:hypothetical protein